jgi:hypothetical protein
VTTAERWLRDHLADAPEELLEAMAAALHAAPDPVADDDDVPEALLRAATALYARVLDGCGGREDAFPLLAADALFTHALEARSLAAPGGVSAFARRMVEAPAFAALATGLAAGDEPRPDEPTTAQEPTWRPT